VLTGGYITILANLKILDLFPVVFQFAAQVERALVLILRSGHRGFDLGHQALVELEVLLNVQQPLEFHIAKVFSQNLRVIVHKLLIIGFKDLVHGGYELHE